MKVSIDTELLNKACEVAGNTNKKEVVEKALLLFISLYYKKTPDKSNINNS